MDEFGLESRWIRMECEGERKRHKENGKSGNDPPSYDGSLGREGERGRVRGTESGAARECESKSERREKRGRERKREREGEPFTSIPLEGVICNFLVILSGVWTPMKPLVPGTRVLWIYASLQFCRRGATRRRYT